jgi:hypothetical protein
MERLQKIQVIVAVLAALIFLILTPGMANPESSALADSLEALAFLLSATAVYSSGRALRKRYEALGFDKNVAQKSSNYMSMRGTLRWWSYFATLAMAGVAAHRFTIAPWLAVGLLAVGLPPTMLIVDEITGWREAS